MPALSSTALRRWLIAAVAVPLVAGGARRIARSVEARRGGSTTLSRGLTKAAGTLQRQGEDGGDSPRERGKRRGLLGRRR